MALPSVRRGEEHPQAKLTRKQITKAKELFQKEEGLTYKAVVERLNLSCSWWTLRRAVLGKTYREDMPD
jgi:hypothetical protein